MAALVATTDQIGIIKDLIARGTRRQVNLGDEDLQTLVEEQGVYLSLEGARAVGLLAIQCEPHAPSLPASAPGRAYVRAVAFRSGASPTIELQRLVETWRSRQHARQLLIAYGGERWLDRALDAAGLRLAEEVIFFAVHNLRRRARAWQPDGPAELRNAQPDEVDALAALDAAAFNLLWHFPARQLHPLLLRGRVQVAVVDSTTLAGYAAMTVRDDAAQVARLAVHPAWQGKGIGRQLMVDSLIAAVELGCDTAVLNTQVNNRRSQNLYRALGFRPTGERFGTYTMGI
jgi:[ribosomal protein S18]-alanine N-acetyltransferase